MSLAPRLVFFRLLLVGSFVLAGELSASEQPVTDSTLPAGRDSVVTREQIIDWLPALFAERLPFLDPNGSVLVSVRPHLGDFFHNGYVRVPVSARWKVTDRFELNTELNTYFAHGDGDATGSGVSGITLGAKCEHVLSSISQGGFSLGLDYRTPFNNSPKAFTDGYRHVQPYVAATRMLVPSWKLLGYGNLAANFFEHTSLPSNLGRNQLHANSLAFAAGIARNWARFQASLTARVASTALTSDEGRQNFQLRPEIAFPLRRNLNARTQILITLGGRVMWGPDGRQTSTNGGVRVQFHLDRKHQAPSDPRFPM